MNDTDLDKIMALLKAVREYVVEVKQAGTLLRGAAEECRSECDNDSLSVYYSNRMNQLLDQMANDVIPKCNDLIDNLDAYYKRVDWIINHPNE